MLSVREYYENATVLVTGCTGFLGKVFLCRLVSSCPGVKRVYLLIRSRTKEENVDDRFMKLVQSEAFEKLTQTHPNFSAKLVPVSGDLTRAGLGLSDSDRRTLVSEVTTVFHLAASSKFNGSLKLALETNLHGLQKMLDLAKEMSHLRAFVYTSTAYSNCNRGLVEEKVYKASVEPHQLLRACEWMADDVINMLEEKLKKDHPNAYTFTKSLSENLLCESHGHLSAVIVRPSMIGAALRDPYPGWTEQQGGLNRILVAVGRGLLHTMPGDSSAVADLVPADVVANVLLASGCHAASLTSPKVTVCNCTSTGPKKVTWGQLERLTEESFRKNPLNNVVSLPATRFTSYKLLYHAAALVEQTVPSYIMDAAGFVIGRKPWRVAENKRLLETVRMLSYFTLRRWTFDSTQMRRLRDSLSEDERKIFAFEASHWPAYVESLCMGIKRYLLKEDLTKMPAARIALQRLLWLNRLVSLLLFLVGMRVIVKRYQYAKYTWHLVAGLATGIYRRLPGPFKA